MDQELEDNGETGTAVVDNEKPVERSKTFGGSDIPAELDDLVLKNDPELRQINEDRAAAKAAKSDKGAPAAKKDEKKISDEQKNAEGDKKEREKGGDAKNPDDKAGEPDFENMEFNDDVIPGIKGETLKKLGAEGVAALAEFHEKHSEVNESYTKTKERLESLLADPVIKTREEMRAKGINEYPVRQVTAEERTNAIGILQQRLDLTQEEAAAAFDILKPGFETIIKQSAESFIQNQLLEQDQKTKYNESVTKARGIFMDMGKFNSELAFKETNPNAFWKTNAQGKVVLNTEHPEVDKYEKKIIPVMQAFANAGINYDGILKMSQEFGEDAVYSFAAKKLGLPVAINTQERDQKIVNEHVKKALRPFLKGAASEELRTDVSGNSGEKKGKANDNGIDLEKLVNDDGYYESVMRQKPGDSQWMSYISGLVEKTVRSRNRKK